MLKGLATAVVGVIVILAGLGVTLGVSLGNTDLLNPASSTARAEIDKTQAQVEIDAQQAAYALELEHQAAVNAEEQAFLRRRYELELQQQQQALERKMYWAEVRQVVFLGTGSGAILVTAVAGTYYLYACGRAKLLQATRAEQQPASVALTQPVTTKSKWFPPLTQYQQDGNGRGT